MPELCRFYGIVIRMYSEAGEAHRRPHFHAFYQEHVAVYSIDSVARIAGQLPLRQRRLVEAWAEIHRTELLEDWRLLLDGRPPRPIDPLR